jgi:uncharacterized SAM-binding protein YcdF (DUF218 family)
VAVLGYSNGSGTGELHAICEARLRRAEREARTDDIVLLSGWARRGSAASEAELMARRWSGSGARILLDRNARSTVGNILSTAAAARAVNAREVVLVTSSWHGRRAAALLRTALAESGPTVALALTDEPPPARARVRELLCWLVFPLQSAVARSLSAGPRKSAR